VLLERCANGLSLLAEDLESDQLLGVLFSKDFCAAFPDNGPPMEHEGLRHIFSLLGKVVRFYEEKYPEGSKPGETIEIFMMAVDESSKHSGLGTELLRKSLEHFGEHFPQTKHLVSETTSLYTTKMFMKQGFKSLGTVDYEDFKPDGKPIFQGIDPTHSRVHLLHRFLHE
jgi:ribosomal protein S18 acetylase RimI-like enzyme